MAKTAKQTFHVVTSADGIVFAVYGSALKADALAYAAKMTAASGVHRVSFYVDTVTRTARPGIGTRL